MLMIVLEVSLYISSFGNFMLAAFGPAHAKKCMCVLAGVTWISHLELSCDRSDKGGEFWL